jgi:hypothetical protein
MVYFHDARWRTPPEPMPEIPANAFGPTEEDVGSIEIPDYSSWRSVKELAKELRCSTATIYGWIHRGLLEVETIGPRETQYVTPEALAKFKAAHRQKRKGSQ